MLWHKYKLSKLLAEDKEARGRYGKNAEDLFLFKMIRHYSNPKVATLSPILQQKAFKFIEVIKKGWDVEDVRFNTPGMHASGSGHTADKVPEKKNIKKPKRWGHVQGFPPSPQVTLPTTFIMGRSGEPVEIKSDWRLESIWAIDGSAEVDVNMLWTNYATTSFLADFDDGQKETLLWHFHVKKTYPGESEQRLFNAKTISAKMFGKKQSRVDMSAKASIISAIQKVRDEGGDLPDDAVLSNSIKRIDKYIKERLSGNHWICQMEWRDGSYQGRIKPLSNVDDGPIVVRKRPGRGNIIQVRVGKSSYELRTGSGGSLQIHNLYSSPGKEHGKKKERGNPALDIDAEYWESEMKGDFSYHAEKAKDTKFLYNLIGGQIDKKWTGRSEKIKWGQLALYELDVEEYAKRDGWPSFHEWHKDPLRCILSDWENRFTKEYLEQQRFVEFMEDMVEPVFIEEGIISPAEDWLEAELYARQWAELMLDSNELVATSTTKAALQIREILRIA